MQTTIERVTFDTYTYLVTGEQYWPTCRRCGGAGNVGYYWVSGGRCFDCGGRGTIARKAMTEEQARTRAQQLNRSRDARIAKKEGERQAVVQARHEARERFEREHPEVSARLRGITSDRGFLAAMREALEVSGTLTEKQLAATVKALADQAAREAVQAERSLLGRFLGEEGDKVTVSGTIESLVEIEGQYGTSRLVVLVTDQQVTVKTFSTARWVWEVEKGQSITLSGTIKKNETYKDVPASVLTRCKLIEP
jgi:hypothetical protein